MTLLNRIAPAFGVALVIWLAYHIEQRWMPVITDFEVTRIERTDSGWRAWGSYNKRRVCELVSSNVVAYGEGPAQLLLQVRPFDAPMGHIEWGPFDLPRSGKPFTRVQVISTHRCHPLWATQAVYFDIDASKLP
ncbi:MAG: hypothetical protein KGR68_15230 [Betaproteobacteria bacterium]|nr:hypothetical protein [Betaproteobacteria bacterium]